jgi:hypothetical protein
VRNAGIFSSVSCCLRQQNVVKVSRKMYLGGEGDFHLVSCLGLKAVVPCLSRIPQALHNYRSSGKTLKHNVAFYMYTGNILDEKAVF